MSAKITLDKDNSNIIHEFFDGDIYKLTKESLLRVYDNPDINRNNEKINEKQYKYFLKIIKVLKKKPDIRIIIKESTLEEKIEVEESKEEEIFIKDKDKYISFQRKAFINWLNSDFYRKLIESNQDSKLNIYQEFVKDYLSLSTPYRGLLVYHGLGTGKTATAVSTAEGLSDSMSITTLLPASLETNFIDEVKAWGEIYFNINNNWIFINDGDISKDGDLKKMIYDTYNVNYGRQDGDKNDEKE